MLSAFAGLALGVSPAGAQAPPGRHVKASLVAEADAVQPGRPLTVGIRLEMEKGWHTYWRNPGDSGLPTRAKWDLPPGFAAGEILWPYPIRFATGPLVSYGYEHDVLLPVEIRVPASVAGSEVRIAARVDWLECQEACLPGRAEVSLSLPVRASSAPGPHAALVAEARRRLPKKAPAWGFSASSPPTAGSLSLVVRPPRGTDLREAYFYPTTPRLLDYAQPQKLTREGPAHRLVLARDPNGAPSDRLAGVLVAGTAHGPLAVEVDVPLVSGSARAAAVVGQPAPAFALADSQGKTHSLGDFRGKVVVLEWWNFECPFVGKHYGSGNMQKLQKEWAAKGVVWLTVSSSAPGKQGYVDGAKANTLMKEKGGAPTAVLLDHDGKVGKAYGAKTTPHMFVIDAKGTIVYAGGIDDKPSTDQADVVTARNYVSAALAELLAGKAVTTATSQPYGCGVKYAD